MSNKRYVNAGVRALIIIIALFQFSCRSYYDLGVVRARSMSDSRLYNNVMDSSLSYSSFYVKRFAANYSVDGIKKSFKGSIKIQKDSLIWIDIVAPVGGIPVARLMVSQDSVKLIDRLNKKYFVDDFDFFSKKLNMDLNFKSLQAILTNSLFTVINTEKEKPFIRSFNAKVIENKHVFISEKSRKIDRKLKKDKLHKLNRFSYQEVEIDPSLFRITEIFLMEFDEEREVSIRYKGFKSYNGKTFPQRLSFEVKDLKHLLSCNIKYNKITFNEDLRFSFKIPKKYERIYP